jgi:Holliday junction resolvase RusA-like endonuclease
MTGNGSPRRRKKQHVSVELPLPALSTNKLYKGVKQRSHYYKAFRKKVFQLLKEYDSSYVNLSGNLSLSMEVGLSSPLSDLSNTLKGIEDVLSEYFSFNDRQIVSITLDKKLVNKGEEYMKIHIKKSRKIVDYRTKQVRRNK